MVTSQCLQVLPSRLHPELHLGKHQPCQELVLATGILDNHDDDEYHHFLNTASADQKAVLDKVYCLPPPRSYLVSSTDQLLLFEIGGAGVGKATIIEPSKEC